MKKPFIYGKLAEKDNFTNRSNDIKKLTDNFKNGISTILISPRRWGKSSLVKKTCSQLGDGYLVCHIDLFKIRTEEAFYQLYAQKVIESTSNKLEEWIKIAKEFMQNLKPSVSLGDSVNNIDFGLNLQFDKSDIPQILELPQKIAEKKTKQVVICIDEFQNLEFFDQPVEFQKMLRAYWQHQQDVIFCLFGSKRHMMTELFKKRSMPFYNFGDVIFLNKIQREELCKFIIKRFKDTGKQIEDEMANKIPYLMECHPYYTQQLAYYVWINTEKLATEKEFEIGLQEMLEGNTILYLMECENLTNLQLNYVRAMADGITKGFGRKENIKKYDLSSTATIKRIEDALEKKEILDRFTKKIEFVDPGFKIWIQRNFR